MASPVPMKVVRPAGSGLRADPRIVSTALPGEPEMLRLVDAIYDAGVGSEDWLVVLRRLADVLGGEAVVLRRIGADPGVPAAIATETDPAYVQSYQAHYHQLLPILPILHRLPAGSVFANSMLVPDAEYQRTEFYNDFMHPQGKDRGLYWVDFNQRDLSVMLSLWRPRRRPDWDEGQIRFLRALAPHLGRALRIERSLLAAKDPGPIAPGLAGLGLTPRERDCLAWVARGASSKEAARHLALSVYTVNEYIAAAMRKLHATSRTEAVAMALAHGLIGA